jgi:hypothetical protein
LEKNSQGKTHDRHRYIQIVVQVTVAWQKSVVYNVWWISLGASEVLQIFIKT